VAGRLPHSRGTALTGIAVVGGGIGGLAAAVFLRRAGLAATVYEQAPALGDLGAGLVVAPNAARLLRRLPAEFGLERAGVVLESGWEFRRWADGSVLFAQQLGEVCTHRYGEHTWTMHRTDLLEVLRSAVPDEAIKPGCRCTGVTQDADGVTLTFSSGGAGHRGRGRPGRLPRHRAVGPAGGAGALRAGAVAAGHPGAGGQPRPDRPPSSARRA
jgi:2-polyprenyl-6-methoxyphenol hydroxylase-like FAD-dependent oxidoreductase